VGTIQLAINGTADEEGEQASKEAAAAAVIKSPIGVRFQK
jgi:hypothetical protein